MPENNGHFTRYGYDSELKPLYKVKKGYLTEVDVLTGNDREKIKIKYERFKIINRKSDGKTKENIL